MSCLIIKNDGIGDLILSSGIIHGLAKHFDGEVDLITCEQNKELARMIPGLRRLFFVSRDQLHFAQRLWQIGLLWGRGSRKDHSVLRQIQSKKYDVAISLRRFIRQNTLVIMRNLRAKKKYCCWQFPTNATKEQALRSSHDWEHFQDTQDILWEAAYYQAFLRYALSVKLDTTPYLELGSDTIDYKIKDKSVAIAISGSSTNWIESNWVELVRSLVDQGWSISLFGGVNEKEIAARITKEIFCQNYTGNLDFKETSRILKRFAFYIGNDTGLTHFASLIVPKVVIICGGGTFRRFFPWLGFSNQYVIYRGMSCFDCNWVCKYPRRLCLTNIKAIDVLDFFNDVVAGQARREFDLNKFNADYNGFWGG